jgi:hypothetical protein
MHLPSSTLRQNQIFGVLLFDQPLIQMYHWEQNLEKAGE